MDVYTNDGLPPWKPAGQKWILFWSEPPNILFRYIRWGGFDKYLVIVIASCT
jgi:hypothetical protein